MTNPKLAKAYSDPRPSWSVTYDLFVTGCQNAYVSNQTQLQDMNVMKASICDQGEIRPQLSFRLNLAAHGN